MNKTYALSLILAIVLLIVSYQIIELKQELKEKNLSATTKKEAVLSVIHNRKSVRKYTDKPVSKEELKTIMKAGMAAPTGHDTRPWKFVAITDRSIMDKLGEELEWARKPLSGAPTAIVVCGDMSKVDDRNPEFWITDASAATQNMLLAIEAMELGAVWCTLYPGKQRMAHARKILNLPETMMPLCVIPIGYPTGIEKPKKKYDPNNIHWEKW